MSEDQQTRESVRVNTTFLWKYVNRIYIARGWQMKPFTARLRCFMFAQQT